jgi:hypothetical protein
MIKMRKSNSRLITRISELKPPYHLNNLKDQVKKELVSSRSGIFNTTVINFPKQNLRRKTPLPINMSYSLRNE